LIECYLIGNRLFKFLSVVLPTHHQYFSTNPKHEELRNGSESQLLQLLEYMEELELMIDEMEYNRYILKDLTPIIKENEAPQECVIAEGNFVQDFGESKGIKDLNNIPSIATKSEVPTELNKDIPANQGKKLAEQGEKKYSKQSNDDHRKLYDGRVKEAVHAIEASHRKQKSYSPDQNQMLKQRIAAVVTASSNTELRVDEFTSLQSTSSRNTEVGSSSIANSEFQGSSQGNDSSIGDRKLFRDTKKATEQRNLEIERHSFLESPGDSLMSWDVDFSQFNVFSAEKFQECDWKGLKGKSTNMNLTLNDRCCQGQKQSERLKTVPKIKNPPVSFPRSVWDHSQVRAAQLSSSVEEIDLGIADSSTLSDCSSDIFLSLENPGLKMDPIKTKIEERLEHAVSRESPSADKDLSFSIENYENSSVLEANSQRKLLNQFRDCVRFLLD